VARPLTRIRETRRPGPSTAPIRADSPAWACWPRYPDRAANAPMQTPSPSDRCLATGVQAGTSATVKRQDFREPRCAMPKLNARAAIAVSNSQANAPGLPFERSGNKFIVVTTPRTPTHVSFRRNIVSEMDGRALW
jgi:hypothetical protein